MPLYAFDQHTTFSANETNNGKDQTYWLGRRKQKHFIPNHHAFK